MKTISAESFIRRMGMHAVKNDVPVTVSFELTPLCNLNCKMCYVHLQDNPSVRARMLSGAQWVALMDQAVDAGMLFAALTGGEALTHPDFWQIYMHLMKRGVSVSLKTNGLLLNEENIARLKAYPPKAVHISLYGYNAESYVAVTGSGVSDIVTTNIRRILETDIPVHLMVTPSRYMLPYIEETLAFAKSFHCSVTVNSLLSEANEETKRKINDYGISPEKNIEIMRLARRYFPPEAVAPEESGEIDGIPSEKDVHSYTGLRCGGGKAGCAILWNGMMAPCLSFPRELLSARPLEAGFSAAWKEINTGVKAFVVPKACGACAVKEYCCYCPSQHGTAFAVRGECAPSVCEYWNRFYTEFLPEQEKESNTGGI